MGLNEIRTGMKGQGRTVFLGAKIERFDFEVLGIQRNATPGRSVIWVKAEGGPLAETGILQGMSGSPCYIDGKLIGAIALGPVGEKQAIGGITPIGEMLDQLRDVPDIVSPRTPLLLPKIDPPKVMKAALRGEMIPLAQILGSLGGGENLLPLPILGGNLCPEARAIWDGVNVRFLGGAALSAGQATEASPLEPGGMVAVSLVQGDLDMSAAGTITHVAGKRIMLFGHPLFNLGPVDLPLWSASVAACVPTYNASYKLALPVHPVGAARLDRSAGVAATLGAEARMVPLRIGLNLGGKRTLNYKFEIMDHAFLTPVLAATLVNQVLNTSIRGLGFQSLALQGNVKLTGHPALQMEFMSADTNAARLSNYVGGMVQAVTLNPYERPVVEGISLTIKAEERLDLTLISGLRLLRPRAKRGEVLPVLVTLQDIQGVRETAILNIPVPLSARPGLATVLVGDGLSLVNSDPDERAVDVGSFPDMLRMLNGAMRNNHAYALLVQQQTGIGLRGSRIEGIPPAVSSLLGADGDSRDNRLQRRIVGRALLPLEREVRGLVALEIEIE
jgi:hypothetical protein